tara:strand:- start:220 stop:438 length:219 start_codon:yes stop_codon:yes gene_type:complete
MRVTFNEEGMKAILYEEDMRMILDESSDVGWGWDESHSTLRRDESNIRKRVIVFSCNPYLQSRHVEISLKYF